ncbi:YkvA family protein [Bacillus carboniphilus]|uniref:YkvA family protein n=1 Tax=Bacillus carboniphilus TaxID=86663 RepID=A0ABY9JVA4_9BACI|nr:YkvA family protein [Bacillus carboniphilus]WLR42392.1 YkvA family protein [Bacillus carboniphilus]
MSSQTHDQKYAKHFSDSSFWEKIKRFGKKAGVSVVYVALLLYYALQKPTTPLWAKTVIISALGYFIFPLDLLPDLIPGGYTDDFSGLFGALVTVAIFIDEDCKDKAKEKIITWFGEKALEETNAINEKLDNTKSEEIEK